MLQSDDDDDDVEQLKFLERIIRSGFLFGVHTVKSQEVNSNTVLATVVTR